VTPDLFARHDSIHSLASYIVDEGTFHLTADPPQIALSGTGSFEVGTVASRWWHLLCTKAVVKSSLLWFSGPCRGRVTGEQYIQGAVDRGCVLVANHASYLDWLVLYGIFRKQYGTELVFLAKDLLFRHRLWGPLLTAAGAIRVSDQGDAILDNSRFAERPYGIFSRGNPGNPSV